MLKKQPNALRPKLNFLKVQKEIPCNVAGDFFMGKYGVCFRRLRQFFWREPLRRKRRLCSWLRTCPTFVSWLRGTMRRRRKFFEEIREEGRTVFFFESPHRIAKTLPELAEIVGGDAQVAVIREATKLHEEILRGSAAELAALAAGRQWRGEFVIGVHPAGMESPEEREDE